MHRNLPLLIAALILTACTAGVKPTAAPSPDLYPPAYLTALPPEDLPQPETGSLDDLTENHTEVAGMYHALREQMKGLVDWLEKTRDEIR